jgi:hypothetical protein
VNEIPQMLVEITREKDQADVAAIIARQGGKLPRDPRL